MNRRSTGEDTGKACLQGCGTKMAVAAVTLCGLAFLSGCPDLDLSDICLFRNNGECDDGRVGAKTDRCAPGTDPEDCDGQGGGTEPPPSEIDVTGTWRVNEVDSSSCPGSGATRTALTWDVTQRGNAVTVLSIERNIVLTGTITGNTLNLLGSFPEDGGITTVTSTNITVGPTGDTIEGTETWLWTGVSEFCSGTTSVTGTRD